jgi:hypothetical protein
LKTVLPAREILLLRYWKRPRGVNVDSNDNISLRGKGNLLVQIDGKNTPMTGTDLAAYLRGIPSSTVEKIEFITNPSSKYDAAELRSSISS